MSFQSFHQKLNEFHSENEYYSFEDKLIIFPESEQKISELVSLATKEKVKLEISGLDFIKEKRENIIISTKKLTGFEIDSKNMTVVAKSGASVSEIFYTVKNEGFTLPVPPIHSVTVGGALATSLFSCEVLNYPIKHFFTGVRFVQGEGKIIKYGGKALKTVAGYDVIALLSGSFGIFGVITEVVIRLLPKMFAHIVENIGKNFTPPPLKLTKPSKYISELKLKLDPQGVFTDSIFKF